MYLLLTRMEKAVFVPAKQWLIITGLDNFWLIPVCVTSRIGARF
jgi:hypothetical protein